MTAAATTSDPPRRPGLARRLAAWLFPRRRLQIGMLLATPLGWLAIVYLGSLALLLLSAFWAHDVRGVQPFVWSLDAFETLVGNPAYRAVALRTLVVAVAVTLTDAVLAFPIAYYMARVASPRVRNAMVIAVLVPLWAAYLVKVYAWRTILQGNGLLDAVLEPLGIGQPWQGLKEDANSWLVLSYLWLPYMILPLYAGLERIPSSLLEASSDLGGKARTTFRRVVLPLSFPALVAGSIFTFSLTLGDYITPDLVSDAKFIGNVIYDNSSLGSPPLAAAFSLVPITIMVVYLLVARRLGAFESL
ncbi:MAG TPA: ABC transporter permease [Candidatus Limnocylindrales bacterium]|nr:ABC transporter permease [Candidatus Limnocylindrales bacterium]